MFWFFRAFFFFFFFFICLVGRKKIILYVYLETCSYNLTGSSRPTRAGCRMFGNWVHFGQLLQTCPCNISVQKRDSNNHNEAPLVPPKLKMIKFQSVQETAALLTVSFTNNEIMCTRVTVEYTVEYCVVVTVTLTSSKTGEHGITSEAQFS